MRVSQGGGEIYPAEGVHRRCMKDSPSVLSCIGKRAKEGCDRGSEVETVHSGRLCLIFAMVGASGQGTWVTGIVAPVLANESTCFISGKSSMTGDPLEA